MYTTIWQSKRTNTTLLHILLDRAGTEPKKMLLIILMSLCLTTAETKNTTFLLTVANESSQVLLAVDQTLEEIDNNILTSATIDTEVNITCSE